MSSNCQLACLDKKITDYQMLVEKQLINKDKKIKTLEDYMINTLDSHKKLIEGIEIPEIPDSSDGNFEHSQTIILDGEYLSPSSISIPRDKKEIYIYFNCVGGTFKENIPFIRFLLRGLENNIEIYPILYGPPTSTFVIRLKKSGNIVEGWLYYEDFTNYNVKPLFLPIVTEYEMVSIECNLTETANVTVDTYVR